MVMPAGMAGLLQQKYAILQQQANADTLRAQTAADAARGVGGFYGSGGSAGPSDGNPLQALQMGALQAQIDKDNAATAATKTQSGIAEDENLRNANAANQGYNSGTLSRSDAARMHDVIANNPILQMMYGQQPSTLPASNKKGIAKVPKTGNTKVHKGEAILNKPAAEGMGRGLIAALNVMGQQKMGMVPSE